MYHKSTWEYFFFFLSGNHECFVCIPNFSEGLLITPIISRTSLVIDSRQSRAGLLLVTGTKDPFSKWHQLLWFCRREESLGDIKESDAKATKNILPAIIVKEPKPFCAADRVIGARALLPMYTATSSVLYIYQAITPCMFMNSNFFFRRSRILDKKKRSSQLDHDNL